MWFVDMCGYHLFCFRSLITLVFILNLRFKERFCSVLGEESFH